MDKITEWQLYCMLVLLTIPLAILEQPHRLIAVAHNNAWLTFLVVLLTGALLIKVYALIMQKSRAPFPLLLNEHFGKIVGKSLGTVYIFIFLLTCAFNLRIFLEFMKTAVMPLTPVSIFITAILLAGYIVIKNGLAGVARISEYLSFFVLILPLMLILLALAGNFHLEHLHPIAYISYKNFGHGVLIATMIMGKMMPVLTLGFYLSDKQRSIRIMWRVLFTYVVLLTLTTLAVIVTLGIYPALGYVFPVFNMVRLIQIGSFLQNMDIILVAILIQGVFGAILISWWMACFTTQKVFNLRQNRFVAAPTSLIIATLALLIGHNNLDIVIWSLRIMPMVFILFFIVIPLLIGLICLFKPAIPADNSPDSAETLHKQEVTG